MIGKITSIKDSHIYVNLSMNIYDLDNLILLENKSKNYIKYNMLPITSDTVITLEDLYDKKVIPVLYYNLNECNNKSYIVVKPNGLFYEMTTTLICDNKTETIKSYFN